MNISDRLRDRLRRPEFPRSSKYGAEFLFETVMGPNVVWLAEWVSQVLPLEPGMRVLDLGCGKAASSIFLAKEFGVTVSRDNLDEKSGDQDENLRTASSPMIAAGAVTRKRYLRS